MFSNSEIPMNKIFQCPSCEVRYSIDEGEWGRMHECRRCDRRSFLGRFVEVKTRASLREQSLAAPMPTALSRNLAAAVAGAQAPATVAAPPSAGEFNLRRFARVMQERMEERRAERRSQWVREWLDRLLPGPAIRLLAALTAGYGLALLALVSASKFWPGWWHLVLR